MRAAELDIVIDRVSAVPLYLQVSAQLEEAVGEGLLPPGSKLGNEVTLADHFGLSRPTMRRAIQQLVDKGLVVRKRGVGTQVVRSHVRRELALTSLYDDLQHSGAAPTTRVLQIDTVEAPPEVAAELGLEAGEGVLHLERLRLAGGEPLAVLRNWLPSWTPAPDADTLERAGLYAFLRDSGLSLQVAHQEIGARGATAQEARRLGIRTKAALLTMHRTAFSDDGRPVEVGDHAYHPDRYTFRTTLLGR